MPFAQLIIGPPGSGKSTYCNGMHQFMSAIGRKSSVVNLDPANDSTGYPCALDIRSIITLDQIMDEEGLGPNGGVMYALEELEENIEWLEEGLSRLGNDYVLFDCPGQVELFTHHGSLRRVFGRLLKLGYRLVVVHLVDAHYITDPAKYISILLLSLRSMLQLDLPHINVLSKIDILRDYGPLAFNLDFYTEVQDLGYLLPLLDQDERTKKFAKLNEAIVDLVESFALVSFETLAVEDKKSMTHLLQAIDRAGGYAFGEAEGAGDSVWAVAMRGGWAEGMEARDIQERWIDHRDEHDEFERRQMEEERKAAEEKLKEDEEMGMMY
ncbi:hypothetical protein K440DRAFT_650218 [Wilcoxina mikolae CBS 423.85]|nr:hypothetical protein K440DRAFT_650218 [Wilcoxina mikolae CBS 423.85]